MTPETLRRTLQEWVMRYRGFRGSEDLDAVLQMGLDELADYLEAYRVWDEFSKEYSIARYDRLFVEDRDANPARKVWFARFQDGGESFIAYGPVLDLMPVYDRGDGVYHHKTNMLFPSCMKFMPYAIGGAFRRVKMATIRKRYGRPLGMYEIDPRQLGIDPEEAC